MKKLFGGIAITSILVLGLISCDDDTGPLFGAGQAPMQNVVRTLVQGETNLLTTFTFGSILEFQKEGRVSQLCMMARTDETFTVTLWDLSDTTVVTSIPLSSDPDVALCSDISNVSVSIGDKLAVTLTGNTALFWDNNSSVIFPTTLGDVKVIGAILGDTPLGVQFPDDFRNDIYMGIADVTFEARLD